jgi:hypothetical protein
MRIRLPSLSRPQLPHITQNMILAAVLALFLFIVIAIVFAGFVELTSDYEPISLDGDLRPSEPAALPGATIEFTREYCNDTDTQIVGSIGAVLRHLTDGSSFDTRAEFVDSDGRPFPLAVWESGCQLGSYLVHLPVDIEIGFWQIVGQSLVIGPSDIQGVSFNSEPFEVTNP